MEKYTIGQFNEYAPTTMDEASLTVHAYTLWLNRTVGDAYATASCVPGRVDNGSGALRDASDPVSRQISNRTGMPWLNFKLQARLRNIPFDLLHCHSPFATGQYALWMGRRRDIPVVATFHPGYCRDMLQSVRPSVAKRMTRRMIKFLSSVDEVWVPGAVAEETLRKYGYRGRVIMMENAPDMEKNTFDTVRNRYITVIRRKKCELLHRKSRTPWPERIWPDPIFELSEQLA
ncbi:MAG: glycosyltransferase [Bacteroidales bacterium]|jgi:hypothetical protein|nr:glycosyltransferase [Bacteroidales bacterium]